MGLWSHNTGMGRRPTAPLFLSVVLVRCTTSLEGSRRSSSARGSAESCAGWQEGFGARLST